MKNACIRVLLISGAALLFSQPANGGGDAAHVVTAKKGIAAGSLGPAVLPLADASWYYDWSANPRSGTVPAGLQAPEFVPMLWGGGSVTDATINALTTAKSNDTYKYLLGFNEPDQAGQANMTVAQAISLWPRLIATGLTLGSPAPSWPNAWLDTFMTQAAANNYRVDFICLHYYQPPNTATSVSDLKTFLTNVYNKYQKPIWLTEFGAPDCKTLGWCGSNAAALTQAQVDSFVPQVIAMLEDLSFVQRYAWFLDASTDAGFALSALFTSSGAISQTGIDFRDAHGTVSVQSDRGLPNHGFSQRLFCRDPDGRVAFTLPASQTQYRVSISDAAGRCVYEMRGAGSGEQKIASNAAHYSKGVYVERLEALGLVRTERIVVW